MRMPAHSGWRTSVGSSSTITGLRSRTGVPSTASEVPDLQLPADGRDDGARCDAKPVRSAWPAMGEHTDLGQVGSTTRPQQAPILGSLEGLIKEEEHLDVGEVGQSDQTVIAKSFVDHDGAHHVAPVIGPGWIGPGVVNGSDGADRVRHLALPY